jgi:hypothetical protein
MNVNSAYLNAELMEEIYMMQPPGFPQGSSNKVLKLLKAIYGLKQAGCAWYLLLVSVLKKIGFTSCLSNHAVFHK